MRLRRRPDWPERMAAAIAAAQQRPFAWGTHDCVTFAGDLHVALTDVDLLAPLRGRWKTERGALRMLRARGGLHAAVCSVLGPPLARNLHAGRGDVLLVGLANGQQALAVMDTGFWCQPGPAGLVQGEGAIQAAWGVGRG